MPDIQETPPSPANPAAPESATTDSSVRLIATLALVAAVSALLVAVAGAVTERPIAESRARQHAALLRQVLPPDVPEPVERAFLAEDGSTNFVYYAAGDAIALEAETPHGYGGPLRLLVGFDGSGALYGFHVLQHSETPGLGANLASENNAVLASAKGKPAQGTAWSVTHDGGDIDALTAATISSRAACEALAQAAERLVQIHTTKP